MGCMEPIDPHEGKTYTLRTVAEDGEVRETELDAGQVLDLCSGKAIAYAVRDEQIAVEDDGTIVRRESALPEYRDAA